MADIELVVKIPEEDFERCKKRYQRRIDIMGDAIANGTPLPKGHGRLKDVDELLTSERPKGIADDIWKESHIYKLLSNAPTIIEADK